jgi:TonB-dependent receptor-like protein/carboxypeptidase family protein
VSGRCGWSRVVLLGALTLASPAFAQSTLTGVVRDETGGALPGVLVEAKERGSQPRSTSTDASGAYRLELDPGQYELSFTLINFGPVRRPLTVAGARATAPIDVVMHLSLNADVTVTGKRTFANLADAEQSAENLVGIALSASQGAITARQLDARPIMRTGEVLETVPGVVISQHSGEGKANQYYLRGLNLDHGTDFATTLAGMPVNMPTHGHSHGYSDLNFMIPELVSGVQFSKGPYFAEQGDFATAGAANINYVTALDRPIARAGGGGEGFGRALVAASPAVERGRLLAAFELQHNDGPWVNPDDYRKVNGVVRYSRGDSVNGLSITGMAYRGTWNSTDQVPRRAIDGGLIDRFGALDTSDGGDTYRYSGTGEWQRTRGSAVTKVTAYGIGYDLNLFSNTTFFLDDPDAGDQFQQADHRFIAGGKVTCKRLGRWLDRDTQNSIGVQLRNDNITNVGLYHTKQQQRLGTTRQDAVVQTSVAGFCQNETEWTSRLRTTAGIRVDGYRFDVDSIDPANSGTEFAGLVSPKGGAVIGPFHGTELYANAGLGFHSNDARGAIITRHPATGDPANRVTPLARASGAEVGIRTVAIPHLQSSLAVWSLGLESELVFLGDAGTTETGRASHRYGYEWANYFTPRPWLIFDADVSWSHSRFTDEEPVGDRIPGSIETAISAGATVDAVHNVFASVRARCFGPRPLVEDDSVRSRATALINLEAGYKFSSRVRLSLDVFNLLDAEDSDIDYFYTSRLPGEPAAGIDDIHLHPTLPRMARVALTVGF